MVLLFFYFLQIHLQGNPYIVCDSACPDVDITSPHHKLTVPHAVDCLQAILTIIPLQLLSMHIAVLRQLDVSMEYRKSCGL